MNTQPWGQDQIKEMTITPFVEVSEEMKIVLWSLIGQNDSWKRNWKSESPVVLKYLKLCLEREREESLKVNCEFRYWHFKRVFEKVILPKVLQSRLNKADISGHKMVLSPSILHSGSRLMMLLRKPHLHRWKMAKNSNRHFREEETLREDRQAKCLASLQVREMQSQIWKRP